MTRTRLESIQTGPNVATSPTLLDVLPRFRRHLAAENKAPRTVDAYCEAAHRLNEYLTANGMPTRVAAINREHIESFLADQVERLSAASAKTRYASLRQLFRWLAEVEGEVNPNPMDKLRPPAVPEKPVPVLNDDQLKAMLAIERETDFASRRDAAILRIFIDTGARLSEVANLTLPDLNLDSGTLRFMGKGRRERINPLSTRTLRVLDRYLAIRDKHPDKATQALWLGSQGPMRSVGIALAMKKRAKAAGVPVFHVHMLRHTAAHVLRLEGIDDDAVMRLMGWRDRSMLHRYGASAADARAHEAFKRSGVGERL